jgi:hypothetical protein
MRDDGRRRMKVRKSEVQKLRRSEDGRPTDEGRGMKKKGERLKDKGRGHFGDVHKIITFPINSWFFKPLAQDEVNPS